MGQASVEDKLVNQPNLERPPKKGSQQYCELVTKIKGGEPFIRRVVVHGRPYWQKCRYIYVGGKRKLEIVKHLGNRKPRGIHITPKC